MKKFIIHLNIHIYFSSCNKTYRSKSCGDVGIVTLGCFWSCVQGDKNMSKNSGSTISSVFSEHFWFGRLDEISVFYAMPPPLTFLLKTLHCNYVNCNGFHKHERLLTIMVQQVPKRWNISLNLPASLYWRKLVRLRYIND